MMKTVKAFINHDRWLARCPIHNAGEMPVKPGELYIPPCCYPGIIAVLPAMIKGRPTIVPDLSARQSARKEAEKNGEAYEVEFPEEKKQIEELLRARPRGRAYWPNEHRNWEPGETLKILKEQDKQWQKEHRK